VKLRHEVDCFYGYSERESVANYLQSLDEMLCYISTCEINKNISNPFEKIKTTLEKVKVILLEI
jgi:hypothetical protein